MHRLASVECERSNKNNLCKFRFSKRSHTHEHPRRPWETVLGAHEWQVRKPHGANVKEYVWPGATSAQETLTLKRNRDLHFLCDHRGIGTRHRMLIMLCRSHVQVGRQSKDKPPHSCVEQNTYPRGCKREPRSAPYAR